MWCQSFPIEPARWVSAEGAQASLADMLERTPGWPSTGQFWRGARAVAAGSFGPLLVAATPQKCRQSSIDWASDSKFTLSEHRTTFYHQIYHQLALETQIAFIPSFAKQ